MGACSSFDGRPSPVLRMAPKIDLIEANYLPATVVSTYNGFAGSPQEVSRKREYRDQVLFAYLDAANARYENYLIALSKQSKGGNVILDIVTLGLTGGVTVAGQKTAQALGAGATFLSGSQGKINERLFYEQTLPALISMMETERAQVRTDIYAKLAKDAKSSTITYGITEVMNDVSRYESAASLERAVVRLSQKAGESLKEVENLEDAVEGIRNAAE